MNAVQAGQLEGQALTMPTSVSTSADFMVFAHEMGRLQGGKKGGGWLLRRVWSSQFQ